MCRSSRISFVLVAAFAGLAATTSSSQIADTKPSTPPLLDTSAPVLWQPSMNAFRRFAAPKEKTFEFYGTVRTIWLRDSDGMTNDYAETPRAGVHASPSNEARLV